jgi:hypothetical protein
MRRRERGRNLTSPFPEAHVTSPNQNRELTLVYRMEQVSLEKQER